MKPTKGEDELLAINEYLINIILCLKEFFIIILESHTNKTLYMVCSSNNFI